MKTTKKKISGNARAIPGYKIRERKRQGTRPIRQGKNREKFSSRMERSDEKVQNMANN
jgi:hypothetical protein